MSAPVAVVAGAIANKLRKGGEAWVRLSWALGLRELGFDVYLIERVDRVTLERADYFIDVVDRFGFAGHAVLVDDDWSAGAGCWPADTEDVLSDADLLVNVSGHLPLRRTPGSARRKLYVDVDPGYTQIWHAQGIDVGLGGHDAYATVGLAIGSQRCSIPTGGLSWIPVPPPVVLSEWPLMPAPVEVRFTTVCAWRGGYGRLAHEGQLHGQKAHEFRKFAELPRRAAHRFELALEIGPKDAADHNALINGGWSLVDPIDAAGTPDAYRVYVQGSAAEFSVAQGVYVDTAAGWFSDRTAQYLASGRPALVQDTGVGAVLPLGEGLLTFRTLDEAAAGADSIAAGYGEHARAARRLAEEYLDASVVLGRLLDRLDVGRARPTTVASPGARL